MSEAIKNGMDGVIINPTSVVGPNDFIPSLVGRAIIQICQNKLPGLIRGGYDWVDVRDVVSGTLQAIEKGRTGERYLLSGKWLSLPDLVGIISRYHKIKTKHAILPYWLAELGVPFLKVYAMLRKADPLYTRESLDIIKHSHRKGIRLLKHHTHHFSKCDNIRILFVNRGAVELDFTLYPDSRYQIIHPIEETQKSRFTAA